MRAEGRQPDANGFERYPHRLFVEDGWELVVEAWPVEPVHVDRRARAVITWGSGEMVLVENEVPLRKAIERKASECCDLDAPVIVALLLARNYGREHQVEGALFGADGFEYAYDPRRAPTDGMRGIHVPAGLWSPIDGQRGIIGVLAGVHLHCFNFPIIGATLWTNPLVQRSPLALSSVLPWQHRWIDETGVAHASSLMKPAAFFGVTPDWPGESD